MEEDEEEIEADDDSDWDEVIPIDHEFDSKLKESTHKMDEIAQRVQPKRPNPEDYNEEIQEDD